MGRAEGRLSGDEDGDRGKPSRPFRGRRLTFPYSQKELEIEEQVARGRAQGRVEGREELEREVEAIETELKREAEARREAEAGRKLSSEANRARMEAAEAGRKLSSEAHRARLKSPLCKLNLLNFCREIGELFLSY